MADAPHPIDVAMKRLDRVAVQIECYKQKEEEFLDSRPYDYEPFHDPGQFGVRARVLREPPDELGAIAGEAIHNMRAALDNLMWGFACKHRDPPAKPFSVAFPLFELETGGAHGRCWDVKGKKAIDDVVSQGVGIVIESLQPCLASPADPEVNRLWILNRLWNEDKHRQPTLVLGASLLRETVMQGFVMMNAMPSPPQAFNGPFQDGAVLATLDYNPGGHIEGTPNFNFDIFVAFPRDGPTRGAIVYDFLRDTHRHLAEHVIPAFKNL